MENFKDFYSSNNTTTDDKHLFKKIDIVLFLGEYDPITRDEYSRINQFVDGVMRNPTHISKFSDKVDIGLLMNCEKKDLKLENRGDHKLTFEEKNYITTKIFGLKSFPVNLDKLFVDSMLSDGKEDVQTQLSDIAEQLKKYFHKQNILIVLNHIDRNFEEILFNIKETVSVDNINLDFLIFNHKPEINELGIPFSGSIVKAVTLLDYEKPNPEDIKAFSANFGMLEILDDVRKLHFKSRNDNYHILFEMFFPDLNFYINEKSDTKEANYKFLMDLLRTMYIKK